MFVGKYTADITSPTELPQLPLQKLPNLSQRQVLFHRLDRGRRHACCSMVTVGLTAMGAAAPTVDYDPASQPAKLRYSRQQKPSARATEVGITSQEAVEFAISYAKQQRQLHEARSGSQQQQSGRQHQFSGPEGEKHYHAFTKSQPRQLTTGTCHGGIMRMFALDA